MVGGKGFTIKMFIKDLVKSTSDSAADPGVRHVRRQSLNGAYPSAKQDFKKCDRFLCQTQFKKTVQINSPIIYFRATDVVFSVEDTQGNLSKFR